MSNESETSMVPALSCDVFSGFQILTSWKVILSNDLVELKKYSITNIDCRAFPFSAQYITTHANSFPDTYQLLKNRGNRPDDWNDN